MYDHPGDQSLGSYYISLPKYYEHDVDHGYLNSRAWVLQERVLAPKTFHFTRDHIYFEDENEIKGEDGVPRYLSEYSCIQKYGNTRNNLNPKGATWRNSDAKVKDGPRYSWLKVMEMYSKCKITYATDKLIAITGLVYYKSTHSWSEYCGWRNILGLWEPTLHIDLLWVPNHSKLTFLGQLMLPTWTWAAYEGSVTFVQYRSSRREPDRSEIEVEKVELPDHPERLPHPKLVFLRLRASLAKIIRVSSETRGITFDADLTREELNKDSPFSHDSRSDTISLRLTSLTECLEMYDEQGKVIGLISLDTKDPVTVEKMYCIHISTFHDEILSY